MVAAAASPGALAGLTVIELASIGPVPFGCMMLADHGARVIRVNPPNQPAPFADFLKRDVLSRNREQVELDLKTEPGRAGLVNLVRHADALVEGFRPGVLERLGLAADVLLAANPALVIGRMTGWGQDGPRAHNAGHDIDYIALSGALHTYGAANGPPLAPVNAIGDYGGGGMLLAFGVMAGVFAARQSGQGQVVDCAMLDGAALLSAMTYGLFASGSWRDERGVNVIDGGAPFYGTYRTADGKWIAIGPLEPQFHAELVARLGLSGDPDFARHPAPAEWPRLRARLEAIFATRTRAEWCELLEDSDACFAPVLSLSEAPQHPHNRARGTFVTANGIVQPAPAPRFSRTPAPLVRMPD